VRTEVVTRPGRIETQYQTRNIFSTIRGRDQIRFVTQTNVQTVGGAVRTVAVTIPGQVFTQIRTRSIVTTIGGRDATRYVTQSTLTTIQGQGSVVTRTLPGPQVTVTVQGSCGKGYNYDAPSVGFDPFNA